MRHGLVPASGQTVLRTWSQGETRQGLTRKGRHVWLGWVLEGSKVNIGAVMNDRVGAGW